MCIKEHSASKWDIYNHIQHYIHSKNTEISWSCFVGFSVKTAIFALLYLVKKGLQGPMICTMRCVWLQPHLRKSQKSNGTQECTCYSYFMKTFLSHLSLLSQGATCTISRCGGSNHTDDIMITGNNLDNNQHTNKLEMLLRKEAQILYE